MDNEETREAISNAFDDLKEMVLDKNDVARPDALRASELAAIAGECGDNIEDVAVYVQVPRACDDWSQDGNKTRVVAASVTSVQSGPGLVLVLEQ